MQKVYPTPTRTAAVEVPKIMNRTGITKPKNRVRLTVKVENKQSQLVFRTASFTRRDVERVFGRMHFESYGSLYYPFQTAILQFWKAVDWNEVPYTEKSQVPTGKYKTFEVHKELLNQLQHSYGGNKIQDFTQSIREYFRPSYRGGIVESKKFYCASGAELEAEAAEKSAAAEGVVTLLKVPPVPANKAKKVFDHESDEFNQMLGALELDVIEVIKKHTEKLWRESRDQIFLNVEKEKMRLEVEFENFVVEVEDPAFAQVLLALKPCVKKIRERIQKLRDWRTNGVPEMERDYKFVWDRAAESGEGNDSGNGNGNGEKYAKPENFDAPFDHQWVMYKTHTLLNASADLSQMGTGKTLSCLMTIDKRIQEGKIRKGHIIVVAPTTTLELAWQKQIEEFTPHLTSTIIGGSYFDRMSTFLSPAKKRGDILLINYESFAMETKVPQKDGTVKVVPLAKLTELLKWDMVVLDECHKIKNPQAKRTGHLIRAFRNAKYKLIMSGTINANKLFDIHVPFVHMNQAKNFNSLHHHHDGEPLTLGELHGAFRDAYFTRSGRYFIPGSGTVDELREKLEEVSVRFEKSECLTLPEKMYVREEIEMSVKQEQLYAALQNRMVANLLDINPSAGRVSVLGILAMLTKLAEAANGWIYNDAGQAIELPWNPKLERTKEILSEIDLDTQKVVIWSRFNHDLHLISDMLREIYGDEAVVVIHGGGLCSCGSDIKRRKEHVDAFCDMSAGNKVKIAVVNQATGSHGINLTSASYEIFYSNSFSKTDRLQAEDRCHRVGMRDSLTIIDLICKNTVDVTVMIALMTHKAMTTALLESLGIDIPEEEQAPSEPPAIQIQQQGPRECLLASCAMVAGKTVEEARTVAQALGIVPWRGTHTNMMKMFEYWGVKIKAAWTIKDNEKGIALVVWPTQKGHAVAFHGGKVFNPTNDEPKPTREWLTSVMEKGGSLTKIWVVQS